MAKIGDTFLFENPNINNHLHIIISDPAKNSNEIVISNFTSWRADKDQSCIVEIGDHPFVIKKTCLHYGQNISIKLSDYEKYINAGLLIPREPISENLLKRILHGAEISTKIPLGNRQILVDQGLIDLD